MTYSNADILSLINEIRIEKQIPPWVTDGTIQSCIAEGTAFFEGKVLSCDWRSDPVYRGMLKERCRLAMLNASDEFIDRFGRDLLSWQWEHEETVTWEVEE